MGSMADYQTLIYYKYTKLPNAEKFAQEHLQFCKELGLVGRVLIGYEGINGTVSGTKEQCRQYMDHLKHQPAFEGITFKVDDVAKFSFAKMHVRFRDEIVAFDLNEEEDVDPNVESGQHLEPGEFRELKDRDDVVVLDVRNKLETDVGKFKNAKSLNIDQFRDFPQHIDELEPYKDKKIIAYCTGGIRCEKATAYLKRKGFNDVYQLNGGIINYYKKTGGEDFEGQCYVFDRRITVNVNDVNPNVISTCEICGTETTKLINCANPECNKHFIICENCANEREGCCSKDCQQHPRKRYYDGSGFYMKGLETLRQKEQEAESWP